MFVEIECFCGEKFYSRQWLFAHMLSECKYLKKDQVELFRVYNRMHENITSSNPKLESTFENACFLQRATSFIGQDVAFLNTYIQNFKSQGEIEEQEIIEEQKVIEQEKVIQQEEEGDFVKKKDLELIIKNL